MGETNRSEGSTYFDYTEDELEFLKAIEKFRKDNKKRHLSWTEVLAIAKSLGYHKVTIERVNGT